MKNLLLFFVLVLIAMGAYTSGITDRGFLATSDRTIKKYQKKVELALNREKAGPERKLSIYLKAGDTLSGYGYFKHAINYYKKALALKVPGNQLPLYNKILRIYGLLENQKGTQEILLESSSFLQKHPQYQRGAQYSAFLLKKADNSRRPSSVSLSKKEVYQIRRSAGYVELKLSDAKKYFSQKEYQKSIEILRTYDFRSAPLSQKVFYDLNNYLTDRKGKHRFLCRKELSLYPSAPSFSLKICSFLHQAQKDQDINKNEIDTVTSWIKNNHPNESFFIPGINDLYQGDN
ncbi:MAG: hypothetical protein HN509_17975 [Halobacteriovoraceae bacterium]|jgi:tetratricopeptide (TPR) repeat protein|nr:hypothetical protein [Halobacteriovoraceae bacterium]MBT5094963.1 hypothetical protein [Halobacteriovoraceae bacterium]